MYHKRVENDLSVEKQIRNFTHTWFTCTAIRNVLSAYDIPYLYRAGNFLEYFEQFRDK